MASSIFFVSQRGEEIVSRHYRGGISRSAMESFRHQIIASKATGNNPPILLIEGTSFIFVRHRNLFFVAATKSNPNVAMIFEYLFQKVRILKSYLGENFDDDSVQSNFTLVYELFDETMDYGYPQICAVDVLRLYINLGSALASQSASSVASLTSQLTGTIDWRKEGLRYRKNEVHIDVQETVSLLTSSSGAILRAEVTGRVMMTTRLTGMPECKFGLNDKLIMEKEEAGGAAGAKGVEIDDCTFHRCVKLSKFDTERTITFIPPDGEFELMRYRVTEAEQPFRLIPSIREEGKQKLYVNIKIIADFFENVKATNVVIKIPMPPTAASAKASCGKGTAKYKPGDRALVWKINSFPGKSEATLDAVVDLVLAVREKAWVRPPVSLDFQIPMYSCSGVQVRFLKVYEKSSYQTNKFVKYFTRAGQGEYQIRL